MYRRLMEMAGGIAVLALASGASAQEPPKTNAEKPKLICKRTTETGSLVAKRRECRTREDWDRIYQAARMGGQDMVDRTAGRPPGQ